jgi:hypothetical protein
MLKKVIATCFVAGALVAGCSQPAPSGEKAPAATEAPKPAPVGPAGLSPGQWRTTMTILEMNAPGLPAAALAHMKAKPIVTEDCVTTDDVKGFVGRNALEDKDQGRTCTTNSMTALGGTISGQASCKDAGGVDMNTTMTGTYSPTSVDMTIALDGKTPAGAMSQKMHLQSARVGDCKS